ncbi:MAG: type IX secretion system protein PorQ [Prevotella sp.]|nr:type IX secretion system protein PorQ [Prevotella sp.]
MRKGLIAVISLLQCAVTAAQESQEVYSFLRLPVSAHVAALGGDNITISDDDPTLVFHNPALINGVTDKSLNLNFMTYMEGAKTASASFVKAYKERASWGVSAQYMDYGSMKETTVSNEQTGDFSARDIALAGTFAYMLSNRISGGISARFVSSTIASYSSAAVAIDLGVNYYDEEREWSLSAVAKNLGGQIKAYDEDFERIPLDLQLGVTKRLTGSPLRFSATLSRLNNWDMGLIHHLAIGADLLLGDNIYVAAGYNFRRAKEMKITDNESESNHGAGLSIGAGLQLERFKLQAAYAKYHVSAYSLLINVSYSL